MYDGWHGQMLANWRTDAAQKRRQEQPRRPLQIAAEIRVEAQLKIKEKTTNLFKGGRFNEEVDGSNSQIKLGSETTHGPDNKVIVVDGHAGTSRRQSKGLGSVNSRMTEEPVWRAGDRTSIVGSGLAPYNVSKTHHALLVVCLSTT